MADICTNGSRFTNADTDVTDLPKKVGKHPRRALRPFFERSSTRAGVRSDPAAGVGPTMQCTVFMSATQKMDLAHVVPTASALKLAILGSR